MLTFPGRGGGQVTALKENPNYPCHRVLDKTVAAYLSLLCWCTHRCSLLDVYLNSRRS